MTRVCHNLNNTHSCNGNPDELMKDQPDEERDLQIHHINAARVCYHILRRLDDLTGTVYTWSPKFDPDNKNVWHPLAMLSIRLGSSFRASLKQAIRGYL